MRLNVIKQYFNDIFGIKQEFLGLNDVETRFFGFKQYLNEIKLHSFVCSNFYFEWRKSNQKGMIYERNRKK
jgi:hypothetical protein